MVAVKSCILVVVFLGCTPLWSKDIIRVQRLTEQDDSIVAVFNERCGRTFLVVVSRDEKFDIETRFLYMGDTVAGRTDRIIVPGAPEYIISKARITLRPLELLRQYEYVEVYAHEIVHALGFMRHTKSGLMVSSGSTGVTMDNLADDPVMEWVCDHYGPSF